MTWIFGYGSLIFRPDFPHVDRVEGYVDGWSRRFWQASTDHRGVPEAPGRVVTVVREPQARCWGVAYRVADGAREEVPANLDHRDKGGYGRFNVKVCGGGRPLDALMYVAPETNENFLGHAPAEEIVDQIHRSRGPSGPNPEYLLKLATSLREMGAEDPHVFELETLLRRKLAQE